MQIFSRRDGAPAVARPRLHFGALPDLAHFQDRVRAREVVTVDELLNALATDAEHTADLRRPHKVMHGHHASCHLTSGQPKWLPGRPLAQSQAVTAMTIAAARTVGADAELSAEALVQSLDGSERKLLLARLARAEPTVVEAGVAWLAKYHAANAERRRANHNRKSKSRRQRKRAEG
jgi:hypothetical protein